MAAGRLKWYENNEYMLCEDGIYRSMFLQIFADKIFPEVMFRSYKDFLAGSIRQTSKNCYLLVVVFSYGSYVYSFSTYSKAISYFKQSVGVVCHN